MSEEDLHLKCLHEKDWGALWQLMKTHTDHVIEGDSAGGFRDRVLVLEQTAKKHDEDIKDLRRAVIYNAAIGGIIGGLIANCVPEVMKVLISWITK